MIDAVSHDQVTRLLSLQSFIPKSFGKLSKIVREIETDEIVLIFDDAIQKSKIASKMSLFVGIAIIVSIAQSKEFSC